MASNTRQRMGLKVRSALKAGKLAANHNIAPLAGR
jgi:hypothetical protein